MGKFKKIPRLFAVPFLAILAVFWLWSKYGNEDLWWWPIVIVIILLAETRIYLKEYELKRTRVYVDK